jgi:hypothetical protein
VLELITGDAPSTHQQEVDVGFVEPARARRRMRLADAVAVRFELAAPVRTFPSYKRQRYFPGRW